MLTNGTQQATLTAGDYLDAEEDSPALEAALLKSVDGPCTPYSSGEMRGIVERIFREEKFVRAGESFVRSGIFVETHPHKNCKPRRGEMGVVRRRSPTGAVPEYDAAPTELGIPLRWHFYKDAAPWGEWRLDKP